MTGQRSKEEVWYVRQQTSKHRGSTTRYRSTSSAGPGCFQIDPAGRNRLETLPSFPPSVRLAVVVGQPSEAGPYTIRVKAPHGAKLMPHALEDRVYTVISGVFYIGLGDQFDADKLQAYPAGSVIVLPGNTSHFHWAKSSEYITEVSAIGPLGLEYLNAKDDPRNESLGIEPEPNYLSVWKQKLVFAYLCRVRWEYEELVTSTLAKGIATVRKPERCISSQVLSFAADRRELNTSQWR